MTTEQMPQAATGVHRRSGSMNWQWRIKAPLDLQSLYVGQWAHRCSLATADLREANTRAAALQATWMRRFEDERKRLNPQRVEHVTPAMAKLLAERVTSRVLGMDVTLRREPQVAREIVNMLRGERANGLANGPFQTPELLDDAPPLDPIDGMPLKLLLELADMNEASSQDAALNMAMQRVREASEPRPTP